MPRVKGGSNHESNLVLVCGRCNGDKANYDPSDGTIPSELTDDQREEMISKSRRYVENRRSDFYKLLNDAIREKTN